MQLRFVRQKHGRYRLFVRRTDGTTTARDLAEGYLAHDLAHLAWERHTAARASFFGQIDAGSDLEELALQPYDERSSNEARVTEVIVGILQTGAPRGAPAELLAARARAMLEAQGLSVPAALTAEDLQEVVAAFRRLVGQYESLRVGEAFEVELALAPPS